MKQIAYDEKKLLKKIKQKPELSGISDSFVLEFLQNYLKKHSLFLANLKNSEVKIIIKQIRAKLRNSVGQFQKSSKNRKKILESGDIKKLLETHSSCYERISFYPQLKKIISEINPRSILDLGCGLNPLMLARKGIVYYGFDVREDELSLVESFFKQNNFEGYAKVYDLRKIENNLPEADLCILLKVIEVAGENPKVLAEKILAKVNCKKFLVSFSKIKLSGEKMEHPKRGWFEKLLKKQKLKFKKFQSENEIFYLIDKISN